MIDLQEARAHVLGACTELPTTTLPIADALGCVAVDAMVATEAVPPFDNSAVDGWAVRAADVAGASRHSPRRLRVVGTIRAGTAPDVEAGPGRAVRIMTGAPVPRGADAIVMVEESSLVEDPAGGDTEVELYSAVQPGDAVRRAGDDLQPGDGVYPAG
ncbi:MAG TPA: hypothetical protein VMT43_10420, partial [Acidimicrobiales bacterium]|nr:hypothetical protein [Acidimicrobiales bacterium]